MAQKSEQKTGTLKNILKNVFYLVLILQFAPLILMNFKTTLTSALHPKTDVGYLSLKGMITNSDFHVNHIDTFLENDSIKGLVLKINCGGGTPGSCQAILSALNRFAKKKPIVAFVEDVCASGAYNVAIAANHIFVQPSSVIGSIGVMLSMQGLPVPKLKDRMDGWKVSFEFIQGGRFKTAGNMFKDSTPEELRHLQDVVDDSYQQFINDVATHRNLSIKESKAWGDGKIFTGNQALALGLVDQLGSINEAREKMKELAGIETEINLVKPVRPSGLMALLSGDTSGYGQSSSFATWIIQECFTTLMSAPRQFAP